MSEKKSTSVVKEAEESYGRFIDRMNKDGERRGTGKDSRTETERMTDRRKKQ